MLYFVLSPPYMLRMRVPFNICDKNLQGSQTPCTYPNLYPLKHFFFPADLNSLDHVEFFWGGRQGKKLFQGGQ